MAESTAIQAVGVKAIDSLSANEFEVHLNGEKIEGVFRVIGLVSFKLETKTTTALKQVQEPLKIVKMVQRDTNAPFNRWLQETVAAKEDIVRPQRTITVTAVDDGVPIRSWTVKNAWVTEISYSEFNTGLGELVEETITLKWEDIEIAWLNG